MPIAVDYYNSIIQITSPTTDVDLQTLHDFLEDERTLAGPVGLAHEDIISPEGKIEDPVNPGIYSQIILILNSPWQIQFWGGSGYTRIYGGKLVGGLSDEPIKATGTAGDVTVLESPVDGLTVVSGSGVTQQDIVDIADAVHDEVVEGTLTLRNMLRVMKAALAGKSSGGGTNTVKFRDHADAKDRITATVDEDGNRTAVTLDGD